MRAGSGRAVPQVTVLDPTPSLPRGTDLNQAGACPDRTRAIPGKVRALIGAVPQIAEEMSLSRHTIKSQVMSIYRKLGALSQPGRCPVP